MVTELYFLGNKIPLSYIELIFQSKVAPANIFFIFLTPSVA